MNTVNDPDSGVVYCVIDGLDEIINRSSYAARTTLLVLHLKVPE
jgi:hypothetical protein